MPLTGWLQPDNVAEFVRRNMALDNDTNSTDEWQKAWSGQRQPCCGNLVGVEADGHVSCFCAVATLQDSASVKLTNERGKSNLDGTGTGTSDCCFCKLCKGIMCIMSSLTF